MSAINLETFSAGTFTFYVGPDKVPFVLYKSLLSRYSEKLEGMMSSGMKESRDGAAFLENVDVKTFGRFAEYIHSGDYSVASPVEVALPLDKTPEEHPPEDVPTEPYPGGEWDKSGYAVPEEAAVVPDPPPVSDDSEWGRRGHLARKRKKNQRARQLSGSIPDDATTPPPVQPFPTDPAPGLNDSPSLSYTIPPPFQPFPMDPAPGLNDSPSLSYIPTFACHISVYHFSQEYLVPGLKQLARQRMSETLNLFRCYPERSDDICEVVQLIYDHEDGSSDPQSLHDMVSEYAAHNFRVLMDSDRFKGILAEGRSFPPDLCGKLLRHYT